MGLIVKGNNSNSHLQRFYNILLQPPDQMLLLNKVAVAGECHLLANPPLKRGGMMM